MKRSLVVVCLLAGCTAPKTISGPGVTAALNLPTVQFNGAAVLAREVAAGCPQYSASDQNLQALIAARNEPFQGSVAAIDIEVDVAKRSFQAKHGIIIGADNTCAAIGAEFEEGTALSVFLAPV